MKSLSPFIRHCRNRFFSSQFGLTTNVKRFASSQAYFVREMPTSKLTEDTLELKELKLNALQTNELLVEPLYISVDPYLLGQLGMIYSHNIPIPSHQISKVVESNSSEYVPGDIVQGIFPMATQSIQNISNCKRIPPPGISLNENVKLSHFIGSLGMPGATAYFGLLEVGALKEGEIVLVSGAAGAVGSLVGQIAKIKGCHVVGTAGTNEKCEWLRSIGFDVALNYKDYRDIPSMEKALSESFPEGKLDVYFDNTGGLVTNSIWNIVNKFGRVAVCGQIAYYNERVTGEENLPDIKPFLHKLIYTGITIRGFVNSDFEDWTDFYRDVYSWICDGKLEIAETEVQGFENIPHAFTGLFRGDNTGKMVVSIE